METYDFVGLTETWVDEKQWNGLQNRLPNSFNWKCQLAKKEKNKGRASGGIITGVKKRITERDTQEENSDIQKRKIEIQGNIWRIITVYSRDMKKTRENIEDAIGGMKEERLIIGVISL